MYLYCNLHTVKKKFLHFTTKGAGTPTDSNNCCKIYKFLSIKVL